jgi:hypothetical protein
MASWRKSPVRTSDHQMKASSSMMGWTPVPLASSVALCTTIRPLDGNTNQRQTKRKSYTKGTRANKLLNETKMKDVVVASENVGKVLA